MIVGPNNLPGASTDLHAKICWMHPRPLQRGKKYFLKHTTQTVQAVITAIEHRINMTTLDTEPRRRELALNDIGEVRLRTSKPLVFDGLRDQPADRLVHPDRAGHQRHRRRRHALPADRSRETRIQRLRDLMRFRSKTGTSKILPPFGEYWMGTPEENAAVGISLFEN